MAFLESIRRWLGLHPASQPADSISADSIRENRAAMHTMHAAMDIPLTGDADRDFVQGMIPHHQGAVDMAEVELRHGADPQLRSLAKDIIAAQQKEIGFMQRWLSARDSTASKDR